MPQRQESFSLFAVALIAAPMNVTAGSKAQALKYGAEDFREFAHMAPFAVASISFASPGSEPSPLFSSLSPSVAIESVQGRDYVVSGTYLVIVPADGPYGAGRAALAVACADNEYEQSLQAYEGAVNSGKLTLPSGAAPEAPDVEQNHFEEASIPCHT